MKRFKYEIKQDIDNPFNNNPRDDDNFAHFAFSHRRYDLGDDDQKFDHRQYNGWNEVEKMLKNERDAYLIIRVSMTDHSNIYIYPGGPRDPWDSGQIGFAFVTADEIEKEYGDISSESIKKAEDLISIEIAEYNQYLNGEFYYAQIYDEDDNLVDTCDGFDSEESALEWVKEIVGNDGEEK